MRVYKPYWEWEDWVNGMWRKVGQHEHDKYLKWAITFTGNHIEYGRAMGDVLSAWPNTMLHNLTNTSMNKRAFLGHCACCFVSKCPEYIVRVAWKRLTDEQRELADKEAETRINKWLNEYKTNSSGLRKNVGKQMLFKWDSR